jgi:hypothetical protein
MCHRLAGALDDLPQPAGRVDLGDAAVLLVPSNGVAFSCLLSKARRNEPRWLIATLRTQARGLSSPLIRSQSR